MSELIDGYEKTHLFACAYCSYTKEIGRTEPVTCPHCDSNAGTYRILDYGELRSLQCPGAA
jgi:rubrerythrin